MELDEKEASRLGLVMVSEPRTLFSFGTRAFLAS